MEKNNAGKVSYYTMFEIGFVVLVFTTLLLIGSWLVSSIKNKPPTNKYIAALVEEAHQRDAYGYFGSIKAVDGMRFVAIEDKNALEGILVVADGIKPELCAKFNPRYLRCVDDVTKYTVKP